MISHLHQELHSQKQTTEQLSKDKVQFRLYILHRAWSSQIQTQVDIVAGARAEHPEETAEDGERPSLGFPKGASHSGLIVRTHLISVHVDTESSSLTAVL